ncbi:acetyl-CoA carboxylase biotin carboxyl carrier protein [Telmatobacter sp. DSM 110680]|uniref:Biotin carboxyl carrier protein of acetyl-CoA carboxylase n=1 Tax=Telmatobacter sp. DSM 110680 TaxID=3036704 RepID=A0AAU7DFV9_9BACT
MKPQDMKDLRELIEFLKQYQVAEFDLDRGDIKIRLKFTQASPAPGIADLARLAAVPVAAAVPAATPAAEVAPPAPPADPDAGLHIVKSPIVGTFYGSPSPGAAPFVSPGDRVEKGQVICIVEAMKLMNEIESDAAGEVVKCYISNGQPIEFGQPLFSIRP